MRFVTLEGEVRNIKDDHICIESCNIVEKLAYSFCYFFYLINQLYLNLLNQKFLKMPYKVYWINPNTFLLNCQNMEI